MSTPRTLEQWNEIKKNCFDQLTSNETLYGKEPEGICMYAVKDGMTFPIVKLKRDEYVEAVKKGSVVLNRGGPKDLKRLQVNYLLLQDDYKHDDDEEPVGQAHLKSFANYLEVTTSKLESILPKLWQHADNAKEFAKQLALYIKAKLIPEWLRLTLFHARLNSMKSMGSESAIDDAHESTQSRTMIPSAPDDIYKLIVEALLSKHGVTGKNVEHLIEVLQDKWGHLWFEDELSSGGKKDMKQEVKKLRSNEMKKSIQASITQSTLTYPSPDIMSEIKGFVGIDRSYTTPRLEQKQKKNHLIICDLDGTLIHTSLDNKYDTVEEFKFHTNILAMLQSYLTSGEFDLFLLTGRDQSLQADIKTQLQKIGLIPTDIYCNPDKSLITTVKWKRNKMEELYSQYVDVMRIPTSTNEDGKSLVSSGYAQSDVRKIIHFEDHPQILDEGRTIFMGTRVKYLPILVDIHTGVCSIPPVRGKTTLVTLVEPPGSGKSTVFNQIKRQMEEKYPARGDALILSFDNMVHLYPNESDEFRFTTLKRELYKAINDGRNLILFDVCNSGSSTLKLLDEVSKKYPNQVNIIKTTFLPMEQIKSKKGKVSSSSSSLAQDPNDQKRKLLGSWKPNSQYIDLCIKRCQDRIESKSMNGSTLNVSDPTKLADIVHEKANKCIHQIIQRNIQNLNTSHCVDLSSKTKVSVLLKLIEDKIHASVDHQEKAILNNPSHYYCGLLLPQSQFNSLIQEIRPDSHSIVSLPHITMISPQAIDSYSPLVFGSLYNVVMNHPTVVSPGVVFTPVIVSSITSSTGLCQQKAGLTPLYPHVTIAIKSSHSAKESYDILSRNRPLDASLPSEFTTRSFQTVVVPLL